MLVWLGIFQNLCNLDLRKNEYESEKSTGGSWVELFSYFRPQTVALLGYGWAFSKSMQLRFEEK